VASPKVKEHERAEYSFIKYLVGGLILITVGISAILELTNPALASGEYLALMLLLVGLILICGAVYYALAGRKRVHSTLIEERTQKKPVQLAP
jgi:divalent metal cation (Fe/Co/Zn/Cd) transporter